MKSCIPMSKRDNCGTGEDVAAATPQLDIRRWPDGSWAVAAVDEAAQRFTLVESDGQSAARVVVVQHDLLAEAVAQPVGYATGGGRALVAARLDAGGALAAEGQRVFPDGTGRLDSVRRKGRDGEARHLWFFPNGSRAESLASASTSRTELYDRAGRLVRVRGSEASRPAAGVLVVRTTVADRHGNEVGQILSERSDGPSDTLLAITADGADGQTRTDTVWAQLPDGSKKGHSVTHEPDGSVTSSDWHHGKDGGTSHEVTWGKDGSVTIQSSTGTSSPRGSSGEVTTGLKDGTVIHVTGQGSEGADGSWVSGTETTRDGQLVSRTSHAENSDGSITSDSFVDYLEDGGFVIWTNSFDKNTGTGSSVASGFDKDGNPRDVGPPSGGGDQPDGGGDHPTGGGDQPDGGGDDGDPPEPHEGGEEGSSPVDWDDGTGEGPTIGGRLAGSARLGLGGGEDGEGEGGDSFVEVRSALIGQVCAGGLAAGGGRGEGGWGDSGGEEGPPVLHLSGSGNALSAQGGHPAADDWGDLNDPRALVAFVAAVFRLGGTAPVDRALGATGQILG